MNRTPFHWLSWEREKCSFWFLREREKCPTRSSPLWFYLTTRIPPNSYSNTLNGDEGSLSLLLKWWVSTHTTLHYATQSPKDALLAQSDLNRKLLSLSLTLAQIPLRHLCFILRSSSTPCFDSSLFYLLSECEMKNTSRKFPHTEIFCLKILLHDVGCFHSSDLGTGTRFLLRYILYAECSKVTFLSFGEKFDEIKTGLSSSVIFSTWFYLAFLTHILFTT